MEIRHHDIIKTTISEFHIKLKCDDYIWMKLNGDFDVNDIDRTDVVEYITNKIVEISVFSKNNKYEIDIFERGTNSWTNNRFLCIRNPNEYQIMTAEQYIYTNDKEILRNFINDIV